MLDLCAGVRQQRMLLGGVHRRSALRCDVDSDHAVGCLGEMMTIDFDGVPRIVPNSWE